jgi:hypothetical protein
MTVENSDTSQVTRQQYMVTGSHGNKSSVFFLQQQQQQASSASNHIIHSVQSL